MRENGSVAKLHSPAGARGGKLEESYEENLKRDAKENVAAAAVHGLLCKLRKPLNGRKN